MPFYGTDNPTVDDIDREFASSSESDELDMGDIEPIRQRTPPKQIEVKEGNRFIVSRPDVTVSDQLHLVRLPGAFGIQQTPFDPSTYNSEEELMELKEKKRLERAGALIRWRWKQDSRGEIIRDAKGKPMRESNARIVKWSDGSYQLLIGDDNVIDLQLQDNKENTQYVTVIESAKNEETESTCNMMTVKSHLSSRVVFAPKKMAPLPEGLVRKPSGGIDFLLNAPVDKVGSKSRAPRKENHAVQDKPMDGEFLNENGFDVVSIKNSALRGY